MIDLIKSRMNHFSYREWISYFADNDHKRLNMDFSQEEFLSVEKQSLIFPSIRAFQKGEGSDGICLMKTVENSIVNLEEPSYKEAMLWFIKEENWHSAYLKKYMDYYHITSQKHSFLDKVFRLLRQSGGLRCEITVLVTAEMIALTYYDALSRCTDSPVLKSICRQMLHDELPHIIFQSYTLSHFKNHFLYNFLRSLFTEITLLFVWGAFHSVYQSGGYSFLLFLKENLGYLRQSLYLSKRCL